jgi:hypothetical protein
MFIFLEGSLWQQQKWTGVEKDWKQEHKMQNVSRREIHTETKKWRGGLEVIIFGKYSGNCQLPGSRGNEWRNKVKAVLLKTGYPGQPRQYQLGTC